MSDSQTNSLNNKFDYILIQNKNLKEQIVNICSRIEESIYNHKNNKQSDNVTEDYNMTTENYTTIHQKINKYKDSIAALKAKMDGFYNLKKIEERENDIKSKKDQVDSLKYENNVLNNIQKHQTMAKVQYEQKYENKNEVKILQEKLRTLKEEYKYSKDLQKSTEAKLKTQNGIIITIEEKCGKIKENIEFKKRIGTSNINKDQYITEDDNLTSLEEKCKFSELQFSNEEKNYKIEVNRQLIVLNKLSEDLSIINIQVKEKEQEIRVNELKIKELRKINKHSNEIFSIHSQATKQDTKNKLKSDNTRAISANIKDKNIYNNGRNKSNPIMSKTPLNYRNNKPFEIKFDKQHDTNYSYKHSKISALPSLKDNNLYEKEDMLNQIENLKNELKNALKFNEQKFKSDLENDNYVHDNQIFSSQYRNKKNSSIVSNKDIFDKIDQSLNDDDKQKTKTNYNSEDYKKPFKPFYFDK